MFFFGKVFAGVLLVLGGLPLPTFADLDNVFTSPHELIRGELTIFLEHVLFRRRGESFPEFLDGVIGLVLNPVVPTHNEI